MKKIFLRFAENKKKILIWSEIAIFLFLILITYGINKNVISLKEDILKKQKLLVWMVPAGNEINTLRRTLVNVPSKNPISLLAVIDQESKITAWKNYLMEMKQGENNQVQISFNRINFDDLISGLEQLYIKKSIQVNRISVKRLESTHFVQASVVLQAS